MESANLIIFDLKKSDGKLVGFENVSVFDINT